MQDQQGDVHQSGGSQSLEHGDDRSLSADFLQGGQTEFVADGKGDEAQGDVADQVHLLDEFKGGEAQSGNAQTAQAQRSDEKSGDKIAGDVGKMQAFGEPGQKQACKDGNADG